MINLISKIYEEAGLEEKGNADIKIYALKEPLNLNGSNPDDYSLLEQSVLRGLGVESYDFKPTRERIRTPDYSVLPLEYK